MRSGETYSEWYARVRPEHTEEHRLFGPFDLVRFRQPAGAFPDPPSRLYSFQVPVYADTTGRFDFGAGVYNGPVTPGGFLFAPPDSECYYQTNGPHEVVGVAVSADTVIDLVREWSPSFNGDFGALHYGMWRDATLLDLCRTIYRQSTLPLGHGVDPGPILLRMAAQLHMLSTSRELPQWRYRLAPSLRRRVVTYIEDNLDGDLSLFTLATLCHLSPYHFARAFRQEMGIAPHNYVIDRRIARARCLLRDDTIPIAEVAAATGFSSQQHMTSTFRKFCGLTPGSVRGR